MSINERLSEMDIVIPKASSPVANYVGARRIGSFVYVSGQLPIENGEKKFLGKVGSDISVEDAQQAAKLCAINVLSQVQAILNDDLNGVVSCLRLGVFINSTPDFKDHSAVANGASDFIVSVFGDSGKHVRAAVGVASLPFGVSVEIDAVFECRV